MRKVPAQLKKGPFTYQQAIAQGLNLRSFRELVAAGAFEQVVRGVYTPKGRDYSEEDQFRVATLIVGEPSAICLISALSYYDLTDIIPKKTWIMVPDTKRSQLPGLKVQRHRSPDWNIGIEMHDGYSMTSVERTIVEAICNRAKIGTQVSVEALRKSVQTKQTTLSKIMNMAKQLGVLHRVLPYIEALS
jgi:predicted transcriptional regulator of viral defense system